MRSAEHVREMLKGRGHNPRLVEKYIGEAEHQEGAVYWTELFDVPDEEFDDAVETDFELYEAFEKDM